MTVLHESFRRGRTPITGREFVQLTEGDAFCYPLYYFIPSITDDGRYLVHHHAADGEVQLHSLDLATGQSVQLTHGRCAQAQWHPWCVDPGGGILDHRSALDAANGRVIYFDGAEARCVNIDGVHDELLFTLPDDRMAIGQNCVSPDGRWFVYIHHDRDGYRRVYGEPGPGEHGGHRRRHLSEGTALVAFDMTERRAHTLLQLNAPLHHVQPLGADRLLFSSPALEGGVLMTDYRGGWYTHLRPQGTGHGMTCHYCATSRGIAYETQPHGIVAGIVDPDTHRWREWPLPKNIGYVHTGLDPDGRLFFYESSNGAKGRHALLLRQAGDAKGESEWIDLIADWPTYGAGQRSHFHPRLVLDRQWILITVGDGRTRTNHCALLAVEDLA